MQHVLQIWCILIAYYFLIDIYIYESYDKAISFIENWITRLKISLMES